VAEQDRRRVQFYSGRGRQGNGRSSIVAEKDRGRAQFYSGRGRHGKGAVL
jgi:hypothetical protein